VAKQTIKSLAESMLVDDLTDIGYAAEELGYKFHPDRLWRFDLAWPSLMLAIEVDGRGRHQTDKGRIDDCQKLNAALELGWRCLRYPANSVKTHKRRARIVEQIVRIICGVSSPEDAEIVLVGD